MLDMADPVERAGTYALVYLAVVQHWNAVCPDEWDVRQIIPDPKATWAFARANLDLRAPAKKRKRSLEGHVKSNQRDRDRAQRRQAAKGQKGQTGWAGKGEGKREMGGKGEKGEKGCKGEGKVVQGQKGKKGEKGEKGEERRPFHWRLRARVLLSRNCWWAVCTVYSPRSGCVLGLMGSRVVIVALASGFSPAWAQPSTGSHQRGLRPTRPRPAAET